VATLLRRSSVSRSAPSESWLPAGLMMDVDETEMRLEMELDGSSTGPPEHRAADVDIYMSVERLSTSAEPLSVSQPDTKVFSSEQ
jgi:hypothetical protein